jgi:outer membrane protein OmpA-like peptidoglycan-associated protein
VVANQLIYNGVSAQRIVAVGYGESRPISSNDAMNRRVEILIKPVVKGAL